MTDFRLDAFIFNMHPSETVCKAVNVLFQSVDQTIICIRQAVPRLFQPCQNASGLHCLYHYVLSACGIQADCGACKSAGVACRQEAGVYVVLQQFPFAFAHCIVEVERQTA